MTNSLLKNKLTTAFIFQLFAALMPIQMIAQKKVVFICNSAFVPALEASSSTADLLIAILHADPAHFTVTVKSTTDGTDLITAAGSISAFYDNYDLVVTQESFGGTTAIWKPTRLLEIKNIKIPVIYTKMFALQNTRAITDVAGTPNGNVTATIPTGNKLGATVDPTNQSNPLFTGVTFTGNEVKIFNAGASDTGLSTGTTAIKAIDMAFNENITDITT